MDQARSKISKIFNGEPHSYTRFNLTQNMEGDNSQVEMKLSSDVDEEVGANGVGDHLNHAGNNKPYAAQKLGRTPKNLCFVAASVLLIFIIGYLIGYVVHRKKDLAPMCAASFLPAGDAVLSETGAAPLMNWDDVKKLLGDKLTAVQLEKAFSEFSRTEHRAGSTGDEDLGNKVLWRFKELGMKTWAEEHFVKVQELPASVSNKVVYKGQPELQRGFLSYSANGSATGAALYAHYGQESEFRQLRNRNIDVSGRVVLVRAGKISFAEKVANAAKLNASAVLIYPDSHDIGDNTELYGHVHLGSGDPYTPGFPSFNHTQFPPVQSSGLPRILAQTITAGTAKKILNGLGGQNPPQEWTSHYYYKLGDESDVITVDVNNVLSERKIVNVFGVIKGFVDPDRYVIVGAQRDSWGPGFAASTVGTSVLVELARSISDMVKNDGFKLRRSIVFASWSAGEYGSIGATEWLEGYLSSLSMKAFSYINLDGIVTGRTGFKVATSPLMYSLIEKTLNEVKDKKVSLFSQFAKTDWQSNVLEPMKVDNAAYPFLAFSGIPSISFRFTGNSDYNFLGTMLDTREKLNIATSSEVAQLAERAGRFAGHVVLRLVHDHLLPLDPTSYYTVIRSQVARINGKVKQVHRSQLLPRALTVQWLISAAGSFDRASSSLMEEIQNSNLEDIEKCRILNDRIMTVERNFLSPYISPRDVPFRHILLGSGPHTFGALSGHLDALKTSDPEADTDLFHTQFAMVTWTVQGCANSLSGDIWSLDNEI